jgi:hypothetical protein
MTFTFSDSHMRVDLRALASASSPYLSGGSVRRIDVLCADLENAVSKAKREGGGSFDWKTPPASPIEIMPSRVWKGDSEGVGALRAAMSVDYHCSYDALSKRVVVGEGVTVVKLRTEAFEAETGVGEKTYHFDAGAGGWANSDGGAQAGHPPLHFQFYGVLNDLPRLPSLIVHPVDILNLTILELHQKNWRAHAVKNETKTKLRRVPKRQTDRMIATVDLWKSVFTLSPGAGIISLHHAWRQPLNL